MDYKILGMELLFSLKTIYQFVENCGSWWPKYCYGNIKFTLGIVINVDTYLFYKRFLEYSSIHTCTRLSTFIHTRPFRRLLTDWTVYIRLFLSRRAHTYLHTLISTYKHLHYAFDLIQHKSYTYLNTIKRLFKQNRDYFPSSSNVKFMFICMTFFQL